MTQVALPPPCKHSIPQQGSVFVLSSPKAYECSFCKLERVAAELDALAGEIENDQTRDESELDRRVVAELRRLAGVLR